jgi:hypothetical protein
LQVDDRLLRATELRLAGNAAARDGDLRRAAALYSQGLEAQVGCWLGWPAWAGLPGLGCLGWAAWAGLPGLSWA